MKRIALHSECQNGRAPIENQRPPIQRLSADGVLGATQPSVSRNGAERGPLAEPAKTQLKAGTTLVREWHGVSHRVTILDDGFDFRGERFRSLSEIARKITGVRWSGPLFFGLKSSASEQC